MKQASPAMRFLLNIALTHFGTYWTQLFRPPSACLEKILHRVVYEIDFLGVSIERGLNLPEMALSWPPSTAGYWATGICSIDYLVLRIPGANILMNFDFFLRPICVVRFYLVWWVSCGSCAMSRLKLNYCAEFWLQASAAQFWRESFCPIIDSLL